MKYSTELVREYLREVDKLLFYPDGQDELDDQLWSNEGKYRPLSKHYSVLRMPINGLFVSVDLAYIHGLADYLRTELSKQQ